MRCNDQPEGDSAQEIPLVLVGLNSKRYLSTGKWGGFSSLPGWSDGLRWVGFSSLTVAVTWYVRKEASGEPKKGARAVTWLPYRHAAVGLRKWLDGGWLREDDFAGHPWKAGWWSRYFARFLPTAQSKSWADEGGFALGVYFAVTVTK